MFTIEVIVHGVMKFSYFSQLIIYNEFINSLASLESGFVSVGDAPSHEFFILLASIHAARGVLETLANI